MKSIKYPIAAACIALTACGGGGGGGGSDKSFFGTWKGDLFLVNRTANCGARIPDSINQTLIVEELPGSSADATVGILGEEVDGRGFIEGDTLSTRFSTGVCSTCTSKTVDLTPADDGSAELDYTVSINLGSFTNTCTVKYRGQVTRG